MPKRKRWRGGFIREGVYWIDRNAHRDRFSSRKTTREGAEAFLAWWEQEPDAARAAAAGLPFAGEATDLEEAVKVYLEHSAAMNSAKHVRMQAAAFTRWAYFLRQRNVGSLEELTPAIASEFIPWRRQGGASLIAEPAGEPRTVGEAAVNRDLAAMMALYTWHRETERLPEEVHPFRKVHLLIEHHDVNPHREVAHADVLAAMGKLLPRWADCVLVLYGTAFRYDSFARINTAALDKARGIIRDPYPKGKRAIEVPVSAAVMDAAMRACGERYPQDEAQQLCHRLAVACAAAGVPRFTAHDLRVTAATFMHRAGVSLRDLQDLLGHADIRTTQRYVRASGKMAQGPV